MLSIEDASNRERAAAAAIRQLPRTVVAALNRSTKSYAVPLTVAAAQRSATGPLQAALARTGRGSSFKGIPGVGFGGPSPVVSDGTPGRVLVQGAEGGALGRRVTNYTRQFSGGPPHRVARRATRQFGPQAPDVGRFIGPAAVSVTDDVLDRWTTEVETALIDAMDTGNRG